MSVRRRTSRPLRRRRHGAIFITALGIIVVLSGLVLVFAQSMRTEALASANRLSEARAAAVEQGAEQWVLAEVQSHPADAVTITQEPAEAVQVGDGYFWLLHPDPTTDQNYGYGIVDESAKVNLNAAAAAQLALLPNMTEDVAESIFDWRSAAGPGSPNGAESDYYESLPEPYQCKNAAFETVEEVMLVKNMTTQLLFGYDLNRDGVVDAGELAAGGTAMAVGGPTGGSRGVFNDVTVYSTEPNTTLDGKPRVNVNIRDTGPLRKALASVLSGQRADAITAAARRILNASREARPFKSVGDFFQKTAVTTPEVKLVVDKLTATRRGHLRGMVNVNTAPQEVLDCLPGLTDADAQALVAKRNSGVDNSSIGWVFDVLTPDKTAAASGSMTYRSYQYSADVVAVSGDGRAYSRVRIVVDSQKLPAKIIYRKDLTSLGWPLPREIRDSLRSGKGLGFATNPVGMSR